MERSPSTTTSPSKRKPNDDCSEPMQREVDLPSRGNEELKGSPKKPKISGQLSEETHFCRLFNKIVDRIAEEADVSDEELTNAISFIISSFNYETGGRFSDIDFKEPDKLCGYLYRYALHGAGLARCRVLEAVENCRKLQSSLRKGDLRVVSLGGGPGNDAIGLCSALCESQFSGRLDITVVDAVRQWSLCVRLAERFLKQGDFGDVCELFRQDRATLSFIGATLPGRYDGDERFFLALENADVILICKLISILSSKDTAELIENLELTIKDTAVILLIDCPFQEELWTKFKVLYLSPADQVYQSSIYSNRFGYNSPRSRARIAVMQREIPLPVREVTTLNLADSDSEIRQSDSDQ